MNSPRVIRRDAQAMYKRGATVGKYGWCVNSEANLKTMRGKSEQPHSDFDPSPIDPNTAAVKASLPTETDPKSETQNPTP